MSTSRSRFWVGLKVSHFVRYSSRALRFSKRVRFEEGLSSNPMMRRSVRCLTQGEFWIKSWKPRVTWQRRYVRKIQLKSFRRSQSFSRPVSSSGYQGQTYTSASSQGALMGAFQWVVRCPSGSWSANLNYSTSSYPTRRPTDRRTGRVEMK